MKSKAVTNKFLLRACPRCAGDLLHDAYEEDFYCLQCGRRYSAAAILQRQREPALSS